MKNYLILIIVLVIVSSCGEVHCPAFPDKLMSWVNYQTDDVIKFKSENDTLCFVVTNNYKTEGYSFKKNCDCDCEAEAGYETNVSQSEFKIIGNCYEHYENKYLLSYRFVSITSEDKFQFHYDFSNNQILDDVNITEYELNNVTLSNVGMLEKTTNQKIIKIYFTSDKGLIAFVDSSNFEWKLIE